MQHDEKVKEIPYRSPEIVRLGDATDLTFGDGSVYTDYLGNPKTSYFHYSDPLTADDEEDSGKKDPQAPKDKGEK